MLGDGVLRENLVHLLRRTADSKRLVQKFSLGRGDADDLIALCKTIRIVHDIVTLLNSHLESQRISSEATLQSNVVDGKQSNGRSCMEVLLSRFDLNGPTRLADRIAAAIDEEGVTLLHQVEELEAEAVASLAQIVEAGLDPTEESEMVPKKNRNKTGEKGEKKKNETTEIEDVWVMRKEYVPVCSISEPC